MNHPKKLLLQDTPRLTAIAISPLPMGRPRIHRPLMLALAASAMVLCPTKGLHANPIGIEAINSQAEAPLEADPALQSALDVDAKFASDFSPKAFPANSSAPALEVPPGTSLEDATNLSAEADLTMAQEPVPDPAPAAFPEPSAAAASAPEYGSQGLQRWYVQAGGATTLNDDETHRLGMVGVGLSHFFLDGHSINLELNGMAFDQPGPEAVGLNLALLLRWDFIRQQDWSLYIDGGAGILGTTRDVPSAGSSFNFTPQVGGGTTIRLDGENRLMVGVRWHHISNGNLYENNPGQDTILGYVGINFPR